MKNSYQVGQRIHAVVDRVLPFGVFVRLDDGTPAYIRRRELDLDADVDPAQVVSEGDRIEAIILNLGEPGKHMALSRRATLPDPWQEFVRRFRPGDVVAGVVQALHPQGVFVRILPGVNGFIPLAELATWQVAKPEELFWVGDEVEAVIVRMAPSQKKVGLSIKARLQQRAKAVHIVEIIEGQSAEGTKPPISEAPQAEQYPEQIDPAARERVGQVLVVDDHDEVRTALADWLRGRGFEVAEAESLSTALTKVQNCHVLLLDLNLLEDDGLQLVHHVGNRENRAYVCVMSNPDSLAERTEEIEAAMVAEVFPKPLDVGEIERFLLRVAQGESIPPWRAKSTGEMEQIFNFPQFAALQNTEGSFQRRLQAALADVTETLHAQVGLVFQLDQASHAISILAQAGKFDLNVEALYGLGDSPVADVLWAGKPVLEGRLTEKVQGRFKKLLDLLRFESCIGVPIRVGADVQHAAFFFHDRAEAFSTFRLRDAHASALLFAALLKEEEIHQQLRSLNPLLLNGQLAGGFGHEVSNMVTGLEIQMRNLSSASRGSADLESPLNSLLSLTCDLKDFVQAFQESLRAREEQAALDVNVVVQRAEMLVHPTVRKERARITMRLASGLPPLVGSSITLQQLFLNLMLNAAQQMSLKAERFGWNGQRVLELSTSLDQSGNRLQIRFTDTGPGIHKHLWEKIFEPGFSTRGGSGLGLYIARNFAQSFGGAIRVEMSFVPLGTTFLVELPIQRQGDGA